MLVSAESNKFLKILLASPLLKSKKQTQNVGLCWNSEHIFKKNYLAQSRQGEACIDKMCTDKTPRRSLADPYHFNTDPGSEKCRYGSRSKQNFDTDPEPGKKRFSNRKLLKIGLKKPSYPMFCVFILLTIPFLLIII